MVVEHVFVRLIGNLNLMKKLYRKEIDIKVLGLLLRLGPGRKWGDVLEYAPPTK